MEYPTRYHAVTLVGYGGVEGSNDYYLCQNSYGVNWGHHGYFKVRRNAVKFVYYPVGVYKARKNTNGVVQTTHQPSKEIVDMEVDTITSSSDDMEVDTMSSSSNDMEIDEVAMDIDWKVLSLNFFYLPLLMSLEKEVESQVIYVQSSMLKCLMLDR